MEEDCPKLGELVDSVRRELERYARTRRDSRSLRRPLGNLAFCFLFEQIDEFDQMIRLWREVAFRNGPGRRIARWYLTVAFANLSESIHALLASDKSKVDPRLIERWEGISPEIVAALPSAADQIAAEGLAFLETRSQCFRRISWIRFRWLETLSRLEAFVDDPRVGEPRDRLVRELKNRVEKPGPSRAGTFDLLETLAELMPDFAPDPSTIAFLQRVVDHPGNSSQLERALDLQVRFGLETEYGAESILESWHSTLREGRFR